MNPPFRHFRSGLMLSLALLTVALRGAAAVPVIFEPNRGQADGPAVFLARCQGYALLLEAGRIELVPGERASLAFPRPSLELVGANLAAPVRGVDARPGKSHYYRGSALDLWIENVPQFGSVLMEGLYPGIDVVLSGTQEGELALEVHLAAGVDPTAVRLRQHGATAQAIDETGRLALVMGDQRFVLNGSRAYREGEGRWRTVGFAIEESGDVTLRLDARDRSVVPTVDPALSYSTYFGGSGFDNGHDIALDVNGNIYLTGSTSSTDFPTALAAQSDRAGTGLVYDAFVTKLSPDGQTLLFSTYLGGAADDEGRDIAVDAGGPVWVTGMTESTDFPLQPTSCMPGVDCPVQASPGGGKDAFVARLSAAGTLEYATYLGGSSDENFVAATGGIAVDGSGYPYVVGETLSADFPTHDALQATFGGDRDAFAVKLTPSGASFVYSTFIGDTHVEYARDAVVDGGGNLYAAGTYASDPWVFEVSAAGDALLIDRSVSSGYADGAEGLAVDGDGVIYLVGSTQAFEFSSFPLVDPYQDTYGGGITDGFLMKLDAGGQTLLYSTFLGGDDQDRLHAIALDSQGNMIVAGESYSSDFPTRLSVQTPLAVPAVSNDIVVAVLDPSGSSLLFATYIGGNGSEQAQAVAAGAGHLIHLTGFTQSGDLPTVAAYDASWNFGSDVVVMTLDRPSPLFADGFESGDVSAWSSAAP